MAKERNVINFTGATQTRSGPVSKSAIAELQRRAVEQVHGVELGGDRFVARTPWDTTRPETLVVCCSDGRWHAQVEEFVHDQVSDRADLFAVPGGPAGFSIWSSSYDEAKVNERAFRFLADHHDLESVWLIAHQDCAYYREKYGPLDEAYVLGRQREDLDRAASSIRGWYPKLIVRQVHASLENGRVVFETLGDHWT